MSSLTMQVKTRDSGTRCDPTLTGQACANKKQKHCIIRFFSYVWNGIIGCVSQLFGRKVKPIKRENDPTAATVATPMKVDAVAQQAISTHIHPQPDAVLQTNNTLTLPCTPATDTAVGTENTALSSELALPSELMEKRKPLIDMLNPFFTLDACGYILSAKMDIDQIKANFANDEQILGKLFYDTSFSGDAAYADDIRTTLAGMNIASTQVNKNDGSILKEGDFRPCSFTSTNGPAKGNREPPLYGRKKKPAYLSLWAYSVWKGYQQYRYNTLHRQDQALATSQLLDYSRRVDRIRNLHQKGLLLGRVADMREVRDFIGHRYSMENDILSTTLWPKTLDPLTIRLFCEFDKDTVGLLLDPTRVGEGDFGVGFHRNAGTAGSGFQHHKGRRQLDGTHTLKAQQGLLKALSSVVRNGGSVQDVTYNVHPDRSHYEVQKQDVRSSFTTQNSKKVDWNEQTYYRAIERDFFTALFVKSDSDNFSKELKSLFLLQDLIRRKKGIFVPIFQFKGATNELEEITPDKLLLSITGAISEIKPITDRKSRFSLALENAGITEEMAQAMTCSLPDFGPIKSLFELQLLMFNMKNIMGQMTVAVDEGNGVSFEPVRILDNLHLVFPMLFKTENGNAKQPDLHFSPSDIAHILNEKVLHEYLKMTLIHNMKRFLGLSFTAKDLTFDPKIADVFDVSDNKKSDFSKVLSRALQAAILFQIYGDNTFTHVKEIVTKVRLFWPILGITPGGIDMLLGSQEMQQIAQHIGLNKHLDCMQLEPAKSDNRVGLPYSWRIPIFEVHRFEEILLSALTNGLPENKICFHAIPTIEMVMDALRELGIKADGFIDHAIFEPFRASDPHLIEYEKKLLQEVRVLFLLKKEELAKTIIQNIRQIASFFGFTAEGVDSFIVANDTLTTWVQESLDNKSHTTEFPFYKKQTSSSPQPVLKVPGRRGQVSAHIAQTSQGLRGGRGNAVKTDALEIPKMRDYHLQLLLKYLELIPPFSKAQLKVARELDLVNKEDAPLWMLVPEFHNGDNYCPKVPYFSGFDMLGVSAPQLMTGPAFEKATLQADRDSFEMTIHPSIAGKVNVARLLTHKLAVTTEGDKQVLRPNGLQYSRSAYVPPDGNIEYNAGNEKHRFRSNDQRLYCKDPTLGTYSGLGGYSKEALDDIAAYDRLLLSDEERRMSRAGLLASAYVTVTAKGGYGSIRVHLPRAYRILYIQTVGAQFEKYGRGAFTYADGKIDLNELEASDFIIKEGAPTVRDPLFPQYYSGKQIPAYLNIQPNECTPLDSGNYKAPYVILQDGALFNRQAFQTASNIYMLELVIPTILKRIKHEPFYLKAILFGGGFFAETDRAGSLRSEVVYAMLLAYIEVIKVIPANSVIEFPRYGELAAMPSDLIATLQQEANKRNIHLVWTQEGDTCDFDPKTTLSGQKIDPSLFEKQGRLVILGAADSMSWSGNEPSSSSVESSFANNSNLRLVMNWWANPKILAEV